MTVEAIKSRAGEIKLNLAMYRESAKLGLTMSQYLEQLDPTKDYGPNEKTNAFQRQMMCLNDRLLAAGMQPIVLHSVPKDGLWASKVEAFYQTEESAAIFPEWINRTARQALVADDVLNEIVGIRTPIDSNAYRTIYFTHTEDKASKKRVGEGAEIPATEMVTSENTIKLKKYGRRIKATYEAIRRERLDKISLMIEAIMKQAGIDRAADAYTALVSGDGNNNAATSYSLSDLGDTTALTYTGWATFLFKFYPYQMTALIGGVNELVKFLTIDAPEVDPIRLIEQLRFGRTNSQGEMAQTIFNNYRIIYLPTATADKLVGFDKRYSIEMVSEIGSDITETQKIISSQWEEIVVSEVNGFGVFLPDARRVIALA
ncbi:MAG: hypothetical protein HPY66_1653 [Firmicutes bacterium]|nr:hypothetical protein [Bacillota bacterium]